MRCRLWLCAVAALPLTALAMTGGGVASAGATTSHHHANIASMRKTGLAAGNPFCKGLGKRYWASAGAHAFCFGPQKQIGPQPRRAGVSEGLGAPRNVNACRLAEDVSSSGAQAYRQSEVSSAASGRLAVGGWNVSSGC